MNDTIDVNTLNSSVSELIKAVENSNKEKIIEIISQHPELLNTQDFAGHTPLSSVSDLKTAKLLLAYGANLNIENSLGYDALNYMFSIQSPNPDIIKFLIEHGANVNTVSNDEYAPLHMVRHADIAKMLLEKGADINKQNTYGQTPLHLAKNAQIAQLLIENGANLNIRDNDGNTPLHLAYDIDIVKTLIENNMDVNACNTNNDTPLHRAIVNPFSKEAAMFLLEKGADVNKQNNDGNTPLHSYISTIIYSPMPHQTQETKDIVSALIKNKADINIKNKDGETPLHIAAKTNNIALFHFLIENGADIHAVNNKDQNLLHLTTSNTIAEYLISHGIDIYHKDKEMNTPLMHHTKEKNKSISKEISDSIALNQKASNSMATLKNPNNSTPVDVNSIEDELAVTRYGNSNGRA